MDQSELLVELLHELGEAYGTGEEVSAADLCRKHNCPALAPVLEAEIQELKEVAWLELQPSPRAPQSGDLPRRGGAPRQCGRRDHSVLRPARGPARLYQSDV
jgi:hypothetical protein